MTYCMFDCEYYDVCGIKRKIRKLNNDYDFLNKGVNLPDICKHFKQRDKDED